MTPTRTALVLGANGRFGRAAVDAFAAAGWRVLAQVRREPSVPLPAGAQALNLAPQDLDALARAAAGAGVVVHALNPVYTRWTEEALPLARCGLDVAQRLGATFMLPGNVYAYGAGMPAVLDERTPAQPSTEKGRQRQALEDEIAARCAAGLRAVVIRAGDFFGAGTGSWLDLVIAKHIAAGRLSYPGPPDVPHAWAYLPDLARAFVAVAGRDEGPAFRRLHFAGHTLTGDQLLDALARAAREVGIDPPGGFRHARMPWWPLQLAAPVWPMGRELVRMRYLWFVPHALDGRALAQAVGPLPTAPIVDALAASLRQLGHGQAAPPSLSVAR